MSKSTSAGISAARAALQSAALHGRGVPLRLLIDLVVTVGEVSEGTAYQALRACIAPRSQYRAERHVGRWEHKVTITGSSLDSQVWTMSYTSSDRLDMMRREVEQFERFRAARLAARAEAS
jgi:hypothetical protein